MEKVSDAQDRRVFERFPARFPVKFEYDRGDYGSSIFLRDASAGGLRCTCRQKMYLHDGVALEVKLPDAARPLKLNGRVVWTKSTGPDLWDIGVAFHKIDFMQAHRIFKFIQPE